MRPKLFKHLQILAFHSAHINDIAVIKELLTDILIILEFEIPVLFFKKSFCYVFYSCIRCFIDVYLIPLSIIEINPGSDRLRNILIDPPVCNQTHNHHQQTYPDYDPFLLLFHHQTTLLAGLDPINHAFYI